MCEAVLSPKFSQMQAPTFSQQCIGLENAKENEQIK